ncbi:MAG TPA: hypothetical protein VGH89_06745 [Pseudonocardia sp.]
MTDTSTMDTALVIAAGGSVGIQLAAVHGSQAVFVAAGIGFNAWWRPWKPVDSIRNRRGIR